ncbi:cell division protein FtsQ/DivIB [Bacillus rubiinfantis]|uniref:cell division protein FtsQ/DivIB n=1 Tax=Bacillus rubiinfantis TaxID=1499680 RepID=UPI0005A77A51|nr:cell division protein FtsQ/DivIB [Bacillus rubiinfantis]
MEKGKIVALEDRIPKLKEQRRRKANRRLVFLLIMFFAMISIIAYIQSPLSRVKSIHVVGNDIYSDQEIIRKSGLTRKTNIWKVKQQELIAKLKQLSEVKNAEITIQWPNTVTIKVKEHKRIAYLKKEQFYYPIMENGKVITDKKTSSIPINSPILFEFKEGAALKEMTNSLQSLPNEIVNSISEIHFTPSKTDPYHISLFMNDGFEVSATLRSFSDKMKHYPAIISQLNHNKKGIIDLEVGSYFKAFETEDEEKEVN